MGAATGDFHQRREDKKSLFDARMRDDQMVGVEDEVTVEEEIEIKGPVLVTVSIRVAYPAVPCLYRVQQMEKDVRREPCPHQGRRIDEPVGALHIDRPAAIGRGKGQGNDGGVALEIQPSRPENGKG